MRRVLVMGATGALAASIAAFGLLGGQAGAGPGAPVIPVTITNTVLGTDPGVAFPITLVCSSTGGFIDDDGAETTDITIPNDGQTSETFNLRNGESATSQVTLPPFEPDFASCSVTEDLAGAGVPSGYTCTVSVVPESAVLYDDGDEGEPPTFTVTNTCSIEQAEAIRFTG